MWVRVVIELTSVAEVDLVVAKVNEELTKDLLNSALTENVFNCLLNSYCSTFVSKRLLRRNPDMRSGGLHSYCWSALATHSSSITKSKSVAKSDKNCRFLIHRVEVLVCALQSVSGVIVLLCYWRNLQLSVFFLRRHVLHHKVLSSFLDLHVLIFFCFFRTNLTESVESCWRFLVTAIVSTSVSRFLSRNTHVSAFRWCKYDLHHSDFGRCFVLHVLYLFFLSWLLLQSCRITC